MSEREGEEWWPVGWSALWVGWRLFGLDMRGVLMSGFQQVLYSLGKFLEGLFGKVWAVVYKLDHREMVDGVLGLIWALWASTESQGIQTALEAWDWGHWKQGGCGYNWMPKGVVGRSLLCSFFGGRKNQRMGGRGTTWLLVKVI